MVKTVKLDRKDNYFLDSKTGSRLDKYDPENKDIILILKLMDGSILNVDASMIDFDFGGNIIVQHNENRYIIDDGYQMTLIKAGYLVYKDFDVEKEYNKEVGLDLRNHLLSEIKNAINSIVDDNFDHVTSFSDTKIRIQDDSFDYIVAIDTVNGIVSKNQKRKDNSLPFYPFNKDMDKYGTIYLSIFAKKTKKLSQEEGNIKFKMADHIVAEFVRNLDDFHFINQPINKRVLYWENE